MTAQTPVPQTKVKVWDPFVRLFHWLLVCAVLTAGITGFFGAPDTLDIHLVAGSTMAALVGVRIVWGILGGGYARFASFAFAPRTVLAYTRGLVAGTARRHLGHNPLGAMMVFALLAVLTLIAITGVITLGGQDKQGPLAAYTSFATGNSVRGVHKLLALLISAMVVAHIAGVVFESRHAHENLAAAMLTGDKRPEPGLAPSTARGRPCFAAVIVLGGGAVIAAGVAALAARPGLGVPPPTVDADTIRECGACHLVYHPSLAPRASWDAILGDLMHHFSADASLDPAITAHIRAYLDANAAEHWDTLPAVMFRQSTDAKEPRRITATGYWKRRHRAIPDSVFAQKSVIGRYNCAACHGDATTGRFTPQRIAIPAGP